MPEDSNWNTEPVLPLAKTSRYTLASSSGSAAISSGGMPARAWRSLIAFTAQSMIVSVRRPRKSNLTRPTASTSSLSNWVTGLRPRPSWSCSANSGQKVCSGVGAITTPPACLPALRVRSSSWRARSSRSRTSSSLP